MRRAVVWQSSGFLISVGLGAFLITSLTGSRPARTEVGRFWDAARRRTEPPRRSSVDQALWEARGWRVLAIQTANRERERLEAWDPEALPGPQWEPWRLQAMARDPESHLQRARLALIRAAMAARSDRDRVRVATLRALVEHEAGDHPKELRHARALADLEPQNTAAALTLRRAARCNGLNPKKKEDPDALDNPIDYISQHQRPSREGGGQAGVCRERGDGAGIVGRPGAGSAPLRDGERADLGGGGGGAVRGAARAGEDHDPDRDGAAAQEGLPDPQQG